MQAVEEEAAARTEELRRQAVEELAADRRAEVAATDRPTYPSYLLVPSFFFLPTRRRFHYKNVLRLP
jgi:hypothetical protein